MPEPYSQEQHTYKIPPQYETEFVDGDRMDFRAASQGLLPLDEARARRETADAFRHGEVLTETELAIQKGVLLANMRRDELELAA